MVWDIQTIKYLNSNTDKGKTVQDILNNTKAKTENENIQDDPELIYSQSLQDKMMEKTIKKHFELGQYKDAFVYM